MKGQRNWINSDKTRHFWSFKSISRSRGVAHNIMFHLVHILVVFPRIDFGTLGPTQTEAGKSTKIRAEARIHWVNGERDYVIKRCNPSLIRWHNVCEFYCLSGRRRWCVGAHSHRKWPRSSNNVRHLSNKCGNKSKRDECDIKAKRLHFRRAYRAHIECQRWTLKYIGHRQQCVTRAHARSHGIWTKGKEKKYVSRCHRMISYRTSVLWTIRATNIICLAPSFFITIEDEEEEECGTELCQRQRVLGWLCFCVRVCAVWPPI